MQACKWRHSKARLPYHIRRHPRKRGPLYSRAVVVDWQASSCARPAFAGDNDRGRAPPYSAGLAAGGGGDADGGVVEAAEAATFFSTIPTAMIEPS